MDSEWPTVRLAELVDERGICYGIVQPGSNDPAGVPLVRVNNMSDRGLSLDEVMHVDPRIEAKYGRSRLQGGEVLVSLVGTLGRVAVAPPGVAGWNVARAVGVIPVRPEVGPEWVAFAMKSPGVQHQMRTWATTSVQATLNLRELADLSIPMPPARTRNSIASILGALDDKIELNRRMSRRLDEMTQAIFKSWFVDYSRSTPARETSQIGPIPAGWSVATVGQVAGVIDCLHSGKPKRMESGRPLLQLNNVRDDGLVDMADAYWISELDYLKWTSRLEAREGDCVITNVGRSGAVAQVPAGLRAALGRNMTGLRLLPHFGYPAFFIELLRSPAMKSEIALKLDSGTILESLNVRSIPSLRFAMPSPELVQEYETIVRPMRKRMEQLLAEGCALAEMRDALLPRLLSGHLPASRTQRVHPSVEA